MNGETPDIDAWEIAKEAYRKNEYEVAIKQITSLESPTDEQALYLALSLGYKDPPEFEAAIPLCKKIVAKQDSHIRDQALWYLSLFLLKANKQTEAKAYLQTILDEKSWQEDKAARLLKSLE